MPGSILVVCYDTSTGRYLGQKAGSAQISDGAIISGLLASGIVGTVHLRDLNVTSAKLAAALITSIEAGVADEGVTSAKLASGAVIGDRIADVGIFSGKIASGAIGPSILLANAIITSAKLTSAIIGLLGTVADGAITSAKIASGAIGEVHLISGISIDISEISQEPGYRAGETISSFCCVYIAPISGNFVNIATALSGGMPAIGMTPAAIASGALGVINYGGRVPAPAAVVSGQYGKQVFVGASGGQLVIVSGAVPSASGYCQQIMGTVKDDDEIFLFPEPGYIEIT